MNKRDYPTPGLHLFGRTAKTAERLSPRWLHLIVTLALAFTVGSMNQVVSAQEVPNVSIETIMTATIPKDICVGETGTIGVKLVRHITIPSLNTKNIQTPTLNFKFNRDGTRVNAKSDNPGIVSLLQTNQIIGFDPDAPGVAEFDFVGKKVGTTTIEFDATVSWLDGEQSFGRVFGSDKIYLEISVKVVNCRYMVSMLSHWSIPVSAGVSIEIEAVIDQAALTKDAEGHFTGSATVVWIPNVVLPAECVHEDSIPSTKARLNGDVDKDGQLVVKVSFDNATLTETGVCTTPKASQKINTKNQLGLDPLDIIVPASGGGQRKSHVLKNPGGKTSGSTTVVVVAGAQSSN